MKAVLPNEAGVEVRDIFVSGDTPDWDAVMARTGGCTTRQILDTAH